MGIHRATLILIPLRMRLRYATSLRLVMLPVLSFANRPYCTVADEQTLARQCRGTSLLRSRLNLAANNVLFGSRKFRRQSISDSCARKKTFASFEIRRHSLHQSVLAYGCSFPRRCPTIMPAKMRGAHLASALATPKTQASRAGKSIPSDLPSDICCSLMPECIDSGVGPVSVSRECLAVSTESLRDLGVPLDMPTYVSLIKRMLVIWFSLDPSCLRRSLPDDEGAFQ